MSEFPEQRLVQAATGIRFANKMLWTVLGNSMASLPIHPAGH